ncbi:MAG: endolytic transglycosylase MltG [Bacteroidales bacterium]|nr:endolytic transglycosylase MltG [Bacteroidales bacterium]
MTKKKNSSIRTVVLSSFALIIVLGLFLGVNIFGQSISSQKNVDFAIETGSTSQDVIGKLEKDLQVNHVLGLKIVSKVLDFENHIHPGLYELSDGMSSFDVIRLFRSGKRKTVKFTIKFARHYEEILNMASQKLEAKYDDLLALTNNREFMDSIGFKKETLICMFLPDTYEFYWNTSARQFMDRMSKEYKKFWDEGRQKKAKNIGLTPQKVMTLASIVDQETRHNDEKPKIAGVYMNRLKGKATAGKLQADPTIKFALNDFEIKRVRKGHIEKAKVSPYSTYENAGLPPGPICTPSKAGIDAVLKYTNHNYYYFCAQPNYSGYSDFSETFSQHLQKAQVYQKWLTKEGF